MAYTSCFFNPSGTLYRLSPSLFPSVAFRVSRLTADQPASNLGDYRTFATGRDIRTGFVLDCWFQNSQFQLCLVPVCRPPTAPFKKGAMCREKKKTIIVAIPIFAKPSLFRECLLPFSPFMSIFRRCSSSRPLTASGRCVSRRWLRGPSLCTCAYQRKKLTPSEGWSIQSWRSPKAVAIGCTHPTCSGVVEGCQLPPPGPSPGRRCLEEWFVCQRYL